MSARDRFKPSITQSVEVQQRIPETVSATEPFDQNKKTVIPAFPETVQEEASNLNLIGEFPKTTRKEENDFHTSAKFQRNLLQDQPKPQFKYL
jgi:hypothetical protein